MIVREEDTPTMIEPLAGFALDLGIVYQVLRATTTDASGPLRPVLVVILAESELGTLALPILGWSGLSGKESMQPREVKSVDTLRMTNDGLEGMKFAHVVLDSR